MKYFISILLIGISIMGHPQEGLTLHKCLKKAVNHYPLFKKKQLLDEAYQLNEKNIKSNWLPTMDIGAKASYQSDVVRFDVDLPFPAAFPTPSKDQYAAYLDVNQMIYDGGITRNKEELKQLNTVVQQKEVDIELHKVKERVNQVFFNILLVRENLELSNLMYEELLERIEVAKSAVENGTMLQSGLQELQAEKTRVRQNMAAFEADLSASRKLLATYIGESLEEDVPLVEPVIHLNDTVQNIRPEKQLFEVNQSVMKSNQDLLKARRRPRLVAFGQAGYGKPGLNMVSDEFDTYYLLGARLSWTFYDWNQNRRQRQVLEINKSMIEATETTFDKNISIALAQQEARINKLEKLLEMDGEIVQLREAIAKTAASKFDNGAITSVDYLAKLNEVNKARANKALHSIQLVQAMSTYKIILGH